MVCLCFYAILIDSLGCLFTLFVCVIIFDIVMLLFVGLISWFS